MTNSWRTLWALAAVAISLVFAARAAAAETVAPGFVDDSVLTGLNEPTSVRFAPSSDHRIFVAEKSGIVKEFDGLFASTPTIVADLRTEVDDYWDRGLLGLAIDPGFPAKPYLYVLYAFDAPIGGTAPTWNDACPTPPGPTTDGCVVSGRLSRIQIDPATNRMVPGSEQVMINDWCQQYPSHSVGDLQFGADGDLYVSGGEGASWKWADYGQGGGSPGSPTPRNPCGDPPAEGGAFRAQSFRITDGPARLGGSLLRVDPASGSGAFDNATASRPDPNRRRIVAYGMRNPFRFAIRPGTNDVWVGNVGANTWDSIDRVPNPTAAPMNFGWPGYEGPDPQPGFKALNLNLCNSLYADGSWSPPYYSYNHGDAVVAGDGCSIAGGSAITGLAFYAGGGSYPSADDGALFFADQVRNCIWAMRPGANGLPDPSHIVSIATGASGPVDVELGPDNAIYYVGYNDGSIRRLRYAAPHAAASADRTYGTLPLTVNFTGDGSSDSAPGATVSYRWDFGDGSPMAAGADAKHTYTTAGTYRASLTVTDGTGLSDTSEVTITAGALPPSASIDTPSSDLTWAVGDPIAFTGSGSDPQDGRLPPSAYRWSVIIHHCYTRSDCHTHEVEQVSGATSGSIAAPDHAYPSYLEIDLTVTDSKGLQDHQSVLLYPRTVNVTVQSNPGGALLGLNLESAFAPLTRTLIVGSSNSVSAGAQTTVGSTTYPFAAWSDGGTATHNFTAPATDSTLTALYSPPALAGGLLPAPAPNPPAVAPGRLDASHVRLDASRFRVDRRRPVLKRLRAAPPYGTTIRFSLSQPATVTIAFEQLIHGTYRRVDQVRAGAGRRCGAMRRNQGRRACSRRAAASITVQGRSGPNAVKFAGWLNGRPLAAGSYRIVVSAVDALGEESSTQVVKFRVLQ